MKNTEMCFIKLVFRFFCTISKHLCFEIVIFAIRSVFSVFSVVK